MDTLKDMTYKLRITRAKRFLFRCSIILLSPVWIPLATILAAICVFTNPFGLSVIGFYWEKYWNYTQNS
jgi:hypothetical protein